MPSRESTHFTVAFPRVQARFYLTFVTFTKHFF